MITRATSMSSLIVCCVIITILVEVFVLGLDNVGSLDAELVNLSIV